MSSQNDPLDLERVDQDIRLNELKEEANELAGGNMHSWECNGLPPDIAEQFWNNVVAYEKAPHTCDFLKLQELGVKLPEPEAIADADIPGKLREIFQTLARRNTFFINTDHMSDRELYSHLWDETLREATPDLPAEAGFNCTYDLVSSGSEEDIHNWLKFYADDEARQDWLKNFPEYALPPRQKPPYDRDRTLPREMDEGSP